jgi:ectoine hydroxylase-related dioxygenase (phytanoyl-CoA dioxygenase family)
MTTIDLDAATLADDGFAIRRGLFGAAEMAQVIEMIEAADAGNPHRDQLNNGAMRFASNLLPCSPDLQRWVVQPRLLDLVCERLGPDIWVRWDQAVAKGPGAPLFPFHQDNGYSLVDFEHLQVWIGLSASDADNGGLWLVPGSHRRQWTHANDDGVVRVLEPTDGAVCIEAEVGDVVLFSSKTVHATLPNVTDRLRWAYVVEYVALADFDPYVQPPYFVAARGGVATPGFVEAFPGRSPA